MKSKFEKHFLMVFAIYACSMGFVYIYLITFIPIPKDNVRFADTTLGFVLGSCIGLVLSYFYGSSKGSADKSKMIEENGTDY